MSRIMGSTALGIVILLAVAVAPLSKALDAQRASLQCAPNGSLAQLPGLAEASGLAVSRRVPGRLWAHNDSGHPVVFALDARGAITGELRLTGAAVEDWEAIAVGPCGTGSCLYIGDIGDNRAARRHITIYRVPEPESASGTAAVSGVFHATYPDGAHDAEALLAGPDGRLHIVTKGETGPVALYRFPAQLQEAQPMRLERVGEPAPKPDADSRITDGTVSPDGRWAVLRSRSSLRFFVASDLLKGQWQAASSVDLTPLKEPQGEGVAMGDNTVFLVSEGGGKKQPGTFARVSCKPAV